MYLNSEQEKMLRGDYGWVVSKAIELIIRVGEALGAGGLVGVSHVHVSGVSYSNIGRYGLEFILDFYAKGGRARVYTTINPGCIDYSGLSTIIDNSLVDGQVEIDRALVGMGFKPIHTCIPYYHRPPTIDEHIAWGESSAVIYANSIYGARTNREGGPLTLAASITGYTYKAGLHLLENRVARVKVEISRDVRDLPLGSLGLWIGDNLEKIPYVTGLRGVELSELKTLLASAAASGNHALIVIEDLTPSNTYRLDIEEEIYVEKRDLEKYLGDDVNSGDRVLGYIGCPHIHPEELIKLTRLIREKRRPRRGKLLVTMPPEYLSRFREFIYELKIRGVDIAAGTCPVVSRLREKYDVVVSNSGKALFYLKKIHGVKTRLMKPSEVVRLVY